ncbi:MAG: hypothetical protein RMJ56_09180 [Gemmataceae bacterium]|nr:hypothetical protein [Gemmata sp.]MDW8197760.1 hypothetical protein [Gemmataceae bacterium]
MTRIVLIVFACSLLVGTSPTPSQAADPLPRFTEEREAAALFFVRKHCSDLVPLLEELKRGNRTAYENKIRELFQITELLAELQDDPKRYDLELRTWKAENKALVLVAKWTTAREDDRPALEEQLSGLVRELLELEAQSLEYRVELLSAEIAATKEELTKLRDNFERMVKDRVELFLDKSRRKKP